MSSGKMYGDLMNLGDDADPMALRRAAQHKLDEVANRVVLASVVNGEELTYAEALEVVKGLKPELVEKAYGAKTDPVLQHQKKTQEVSDELSEGYLQRIEDVIQAGHEEGELVEYGEAMRLAAERYPDEYSDYLKTIGITR